MKIRPIAPLLALLATPLLCLAQSEQQGLEALPEAPPPPPPPVESGEPLEPDVTIIRKKDVTVEEHRLNGKLYMIKVTPIVGPPYYLLDNNGDGVLETNMSEIYDDFVVPQWVLFSW